KRQFYIALAVLAVAGVFGGMVADRVVTQSATAQPAAELPAAADEADLRDQMLGIVVDGEFQRVAKGEALAVTTRLTSIQMQAAIAPEAAELDLRAFEGRAVMVAGIDGGGWVYEAAVIDYAGAILTEVVMETYSGEE
ncbi:MAG: hypothetical protein QGI33_04100, partial [Candidatus Brocadiia bacterium]|nr:hypothetical protein [Candidatus Brocadiia bacterium]